MGKSVKKTQEQIQNELHTVYPNIDIISEYTGANDKVILKCNDCGYSWKTVARSVIKSKHGCPNCGVASAYLENSIKNFKEKIEDSNFEYVRYEGKQNGIHIVTVKCKTCGAERTTNMNNILRFGCDNCARKTMSQCQPRSIYEFIRKAISVHGNKYDYSKVNYINDKEKVCIICPEHGEFWQAPNKHLIRQQGCPTCTGSSLEQITNTVLLESKVTFLKEQHIVYKGKHMFVDFVVKHKDKTFFIELNGEQHYKRIDYFRDLEIQQERDALLQEYCDINNIVLYWVRFDEIIKQRIEDIIKEITAV